MSEISKNMPAEAKEEFSRWLGEGKERFEKARIEHERLSSEYLAKAESAQTANELYELFCNAKFWHYQKDLIELASKNTNQTNFEFLYKVTENSNVISTAKKEKQFYEDKDYYLTKGYQDEKLGIDEKPRWTSISVDAMFESDYFIADYEEYLFKLLIKSFESYNAAEFREKAEDNLLLILKSLQHKEKEFNEERKRFDNSGDEWTEREQDYVSSKWESETFGYSDFYFNGTYADIISALGHVGSDKSIRPIIEIAQSKPVELIGTMSKTLAKLSSEKASGAVFVKYGEIIDQTNKIREYIKDHFGKTQSGPTITNRIAVYLVKRATDLLANFTKSKNHESETVLKQLDAIKSDIVLFAATFKEVSKDKEFSAEEFVFKSMEIRDSLELTEEEREQMKKIFVANRPEFSQELLNSDLEEFNHYLNEKGHQFRILKQDKDVVAFLRLDILPSGRIYAGSFNLDPNAKGTSVAIAMAKITIEQFGQDHEIEADCYSKNKSLLLFYKRMGGFKEVGVTDKGDVEKELVKLVRPKTAASRLSEAAA